MKRTEFVLATKLLLVCFLVGCSSKPMNFNHILIKDQESAVKIAEIVWINLYGEQVLEHKPFVAELKGDVWEVSGTALELGGYPYAEINRWTCKFEKMIHYK